MGLNFSLIYGLQLTPGIWTDVAPDVLVEPSTIGKTGMPNNKTLTRVANTGTLTFSLRNDESCSAGVANRYTPGHANCVAGFTMGLAVRLQVKYSYLPSVTVFYGTIPKGGIKVVTLIGTGYVEVQAVDYMDQLARYKMLLPPYTTLKTMEEIATLIVAEGNKQPLGTYFQAGSTTYNTVFDLVRSWTTAMGELNKVCLSEPGYAYVSPFLTGLGLSDPGNLDECLITEGQMTRSNTINLSQVITTIDESVVRRITEAGDVRITEGGDIRIVDLAATTGDAEFDNSMFTFESSHASNYTNSVKVIIRPRKFDTGGTTVLASNDKPFRLISGETKVMQLNFRDPANLATNVTAILPLTPLVEGTDYKFTVNEDGTGGDISANLTAGLSYKEGMEGIKFTMTPTATGWVFILQARGNGIYTYNPVTSKAENATLILADGEVPLTFDMAYRDVPLDGDTIAAAFLDKFENKETIVDRADYVANRSVFLLMAFLMLRIGSKVRVKNTRQGVSEEFFINGKEFTITPGPVIHYVFILCPAAYSTYAYWELEVVGKSEIEATTWVA